MTFLKKLHSNYSIFPAKPNKSPAVRSWTPYRTKKIVFEQLEGHEFFGLCCGFEQLEVIDVDNHFDDADELFKYIADNFNLDEFPVVKTGGGGYHIYYKCENIQGNTKLAQRINAKGRPETLVETRGVGGYVIAPPSKGYEVIQGDLFECPTITIEQRREILGICRSLNEVEKEKAPEQINNSTGSDISPGDAYNADLTNVAETISLLRTHG